MDSSSNVVDSDRMVPTRAPSVRRILLASSVLAIGLGVWAAVEGTWLPFLVLVAPLVLAGPFPWRRFFFETRAGSALLGLVWGGMWFGVFMSLINHRSEWAGGLFVGVLMAVGQGIAWSETQKRRSRRFPWRRFQAPFGPPR